MDFVGTFANQKQPADDQYQVPAGNLHSKNSNRGAVSRTIQEIENNKDNARHHREGQSKIARLSLLGCRQLTRQNREEMTLSMPKTISSASSVANATQASGFVIQSMI